MGPWRDGLGLHWCLMRSTYSFGHLSLLFGSPNNSYQMFIVWSYARVRTVSFSPISSPHHLTVILPDTHIINYLRDYRDCRWNMVGIPRYPTECHLNTKVVFFFSSLTFYLYIFLLLYFWRLGGFPWSYHILSLLITVLSRPSYNHLQTI